MNKNNIVTLFHAPQSHSSATLVLLEELEVPYKLRMVNMKAGEQRQATYLAINPMGKVPALQHFDEVVTEQSAIFLYLADLYPEASLTPPIESYLRGPYLRWMVYYATCYEPLLVDKALQCKAAVFSKPPCGDFDTMLDIIIKQLGADPYLLGDRLSVADILWASALQWGTQCRIVPEMAVITEYVKRITSRPSFVKVAAMDAAWAAEHERLCNESLFEELAYQ
ncbi:glutathione S-transferase family protein [Undibacterium sp. TJN19]|uniref:glutathione S-transferase family protein n=1 Tax=Undibacterium sp. TJN19 TaxID=3413055 RepID=UPI003BF0F6A4